MARLAATDQPIDAGQVQTFQMAEQRLRTNESHRGRDPTKVISPMHESAIFYRHPDPDVRWPFQLMSNGSESLMALRKHLKCVPFRLGHDFEDLLQVLDRHVFVEEIGHRIHEHESRPRPA